MNMESADASKTHKSVDGAQPAKEWSVGGFVHAELSLLGSLKDNFKEAFKDELKDNWKTLAVEAGVGIVAGAAVAAVTRNPALVGRTIGQILGRENPLALGQAWAPAVGSTMKVVPWAMGGLAAVDAGSRLGTPAWDLMLHPENEAADKQKFAHNVAGLTQDY